MYEKVLTLLESTKFPKHLRKNISSFQIETMTLGVIHRQFTKYSGYSLDTVKYRELYDALIELADQIAPDHEFTTITINKNVICPPHKDRKNVGDTLIVAVGSYTGGELVIENKVIDIHEKPHFFNGFLQQHHNLPHIGNRYSLMFYKFRTSLDLVSRPEDMKIIEEVYYGNCYQRDDFGIEHGEHWIDIGAHIGCFSKKVLCNGATVDSYEPSPDSYELLIRNCGQGYNVAVAHNAGMATLIPGSRHYFDRIIPDNAGKIPVVAFNEIVKPGDCVKMDIEGGEMDILDNSDFTGIKKMVIAYHTNRDNRTDNLLKRIARLEQFFARVRHQPIKGEKINMFPNELFIYCDQKSLIKPKIIRKF